MRAKRPPAKVKSPAKAKVAADGPQIPLWASCSFTFSLPEAAAQSPSAPRGPDDTRLPQEMIDYIIDFLHDDARSLASCAEAARTFVESSRFHLFGTFHIKEDRVFQGILQTSSCATAGRAIRTLCLGTTSVLAKKPVLKVPLSSLETLLTDLPSLSRLYILNVHLDLQKRPQADLSQTVHTPAPKAIQYLWLYKVSSASTRRPLSQNDLLSILRLFSNIETLNFSCGLEKRSSSHTDIQPEANSLTPNIQSFKFCSSSVAASFMRSLRLAPTAHGLRAVEVCAQDRETLVALGELLYDVRNTITELTVDCRSRNSFHIIGDANAMRQALNIPRNLQGASSLRTVKFKLHMSHNDAPLLEWHWQFVVGLINDVAKAVPAVDCCTFLIALAGYYPLKRLEAANWHTLDHALQQFKGLRRISIGVSNSSPFEWRKADQKKTNQALHDVFANMLPTWKTKGILLPLEA